MMKRTRMISRWAVGTFSAALLWVGAGWATADDDKPAPENKSEKKATPNREERNPNQLLGVEDLKKKIEAAAKKGDIDTVHRLLDRMERQLTARPPRDLGRLRPLPPGFGGPQADQMREMMERSMRSFEKALEQLKDNPEARAQIEKALDAMRHNNGARRFGPGEFPGFGGFGSRRAGSPRFGVGVAPVSEELAEQLGVPKGQGVVVKEVFPDTPADKAGLKKNDVILAFNGESVNGDVQTFAREVSDAKAGQKLTITILRKGKKQTLKGIELPKRRANRADNGSKVTFEEMAVRLTNGKFEINAKKGGVRYNLRGQTEDNGTPELSKITITDGGDEKDYKSLADVPAEYRSAVKQLLTSVNGSR